jgi:hypothetical protein
MKTNEPYRRYVIVDRRDDRSGVRRLGLVRLVGVLDVASCPGPQPVKPAR